MDRSPDRSRDPRLQGGRRDDPPYREREYRASGRGNGGYEEDPQRSTNYDHGRRRPISPPPRRVPSPPPRRMRSPPLGPRAGGGQKRGIDSVNGRDSGNYSHAVDHRRSIDRNGSDGYRDRRISRPTYNDPSVSSRHSSPDRGRRAITPIDKALELQNLESFLRIMIATFTAMDQETKTATMVERLAAFTTDNTQSAIVEARRQLQAARDDVRDKMSTLYEAWIPLITRRPVPQNQPGMSSGPISLDGLMARVAQLEKGMSDMKAIGNGNGRLELPPPTPVSAPPRGDPRLARIQNGDTDDSGPSNKRQKSNAQSDEVADGLVRIKAMETLLLGFEERFNQMENLAYQTGAAGAQGGAAEAEMKSWDDLENMRDPTRRLRGQAASIEEVGPVEDGWDDLENARDPHRQLRGPEKPVEEVASWDDLENSRDPLRELRGPAAPAVAPAVVNSIVTDELLAAQAQKFEEQASLVSVLRQNVRNMGETIKELKEDKEASERIREADKTEVENALEGMMTLVKQTCDKEAQDALQGMYLSIKETCEKEAKEALEAKMVVIKEMCEKEAKEALEAKMAIIKETCAREAKGAIEDKTGFIEETCFKAIRKALTLIKDNKKETSVAAKARKNSPAPRQSAPKPSLSTPASSAATPAPSSSVAGPTSSLPTGPSQATQQRDSEPSQRAPTPAQSEMAVAQPPASKAVAQNATHGLNAQNTQNPPPTSIEGSAGKSASSAPRQSSQMASNTNPATSNPSSSAISPTVGTEQRQPVAQSTSSGPGPNRNSQPPSTSAQSAVAHAQQSRGSNGHSAPSHPSLPSRPSGVSLPSEARNGNQTRERQHSGPSNPSYSPYQHNRGNESSSSRPPTPTLPPPPSNPLPPLPTAKPASASSSRRSSEDMDMDIYPPDDESPAKPQSAAFTRANPPHQQDGTAPSAVQRQGADTPLNASSPREQTAAENPVSGPVASANSQRAATGSRPTSSSGAAPLPASQRPTWTTSASVSTATPPPTAATQHQASSGSTAAPGSSNPATGSAPRPASTLQESQSNNSTPSSLPAQDPTSAASTGMAKSASGQALSAPSTQPEYSRPIPPPPFNLGVPPPSTPASSNIPPPPFNLDTGRPPAPASINRPLPPFAPAPAPSSAPAPVSSVSHMMALSSTLRQRIKDGMSVEAAQQNLPTAARNTLAGLSASQVEELIYKGANDWTCLSGKRVPTPPSGAAPPPPPPTPPQLGPGPYSAPDSSNNPTSALAARITTGSKGPLSNRIGAGGAPMPVVDQNGYPVYPPTIPAATTIAELNGFRGLNTSLGFNPKSAAAAQQRIAAAEAEMERLAPSRSPSYQNVSAGHMPLPQRGSDGDVRMTEPSQVASEPKPAPRQSGGFGVGSSLGARLGNAFGFGQRRD